MRNKIFLTLVFCLSFITSLFTNGIAQEFCVDTPQELQDALAIAGYNGENDVIKVVQGVYKVSEVGGPFDYSTTQDFSLSLLGGYTANCSARVLNPTNTILDGENLYPVIHLFPGSNTSGSLLFQGFTVRNAYGHMIHYESGGLSIGNAAGHSGNVTVDHNIFIDNHTEYIGGGLEGGSDLGVTRIENNLFVNNTAGVAHGGASITSNGLAYIINNTIVSNSGPDRGGLRIGGSAKLIQISNNIFYHNTNGDIKASGSNVFFSHNIVESTAESLIPENHDNIIVGDPGFIGGGNYHLKKGSLAIDAGNNTLAYGSITTDLEGVYRIIGGIVDLGAYEFFTLNLPTSKHVFVYNPTFSPIRSQIPEEAKPIGLGSIATGGRNLNLDISLPPFAEKVDIYFGFSATPYGNKIFLMKGDGTFVDSSEEISPWKSSWTDDIEISFLKETPIEDLPNGIYTLYLLVCPAGDLSKYYLWSTSFNTDL